MSLVFLISWRLKRYDVVDIAWGLVFIVIAITAVLVHSPTPITAIIATGLVIVWGTRLALHIGNRWRHSQQEDRRYIELRRKWPKRFIDLQIFVKIFLTQGLLASFIMLPVIIMSAGLSTNISLLTVAGVSIWCIGFIIELVADRQLSKFLKQPTESGKLMTTGLWRYSRHPNYFGEILLWWGIGIVGLYQVAGVFGLIGPLFITFLIVFVSGIPPAERGMTKKAGWNDYKARTSVLIPLRTRKLR